MTINYSTTSACAALSGTTLIYQPLRSCSAASVRTINYSYRKPATSSEMTLKLPISGVIPRVRDDDKLEAPCTARNGRHHGAHYSDYAPCVPAQQLTISIAMRIRAYRANADQRYGPAVIATLGARFCQLGTESAMPHTCSTRSDSAVTQTIVTSVHTSAMTKNYKPRAMYATLTVTIRSARPRATNTFHCERDMRTQHNYRCITRPRRQHRLRHTRLPSRHTVGHTTHVSYTNRLSSRPSHRLSRTVVRDD